MTVTAGDNRPDWDSYFLDIARAVAERTDCRRTKCGAVLVDLGRRIVGSGYPGTMSGRPGCLAGACPRGLKDHTDQPPLAAYDDCISTHAEANAVLHSDRHLYRGGTIYVTRQPCHWCFKLIQGAGLARVIYPGARNTTDYTVGDRVLTAVTDAVVTVDMFTWRAA